MAKQYTKQQEQSVAQLAVTVIVSFVLANALGSWAIDSGNIAVYALTYFAVYICVSSSWQLVRHYVNKGNHDKKPTARRAKKAH